MDESPNETFGQRVARLRAAAKLTQDGLAEKAELSIGSLRNYEYDHRRPRADAALRLARALGVTVEELLAVPSSKPARAKVQDSPTLRVLKRAWARATDTERKAFLEFIAADRQARGEPKKVSNERGKRSGEAKQTRPPGNAVQSRSRRERHGT